MDLGKAGVIAEGEALESSAPRVGYRVVVVLLRALLIAFLSFIILGICMAAGAYRGIIDDTPEISDANIMPMGFASFIYDRDGNEVRKLNSVNGNRVSVSLDEIPLNMQHAIVAIEDSRFYEHNGVDPHGMIRAVIVALSSGFSRSEGASTITQQLLKNNVFTGWMTETKTQRIERKIQEQYLAVELEKSLREAGEDPKAVILENYLNTVNFGNGAYGVQTAAQTYFGKNARDLTLSECAVLAAIPQNPSQFNPILYPEENASRMHTVLEYMLEQNYITQDEYNEAMSDNVYDRIKENSASVSTEEEVYSYFVDELISQVKQDLMAQKGYTEAQANSAIYSGGLKIYSTEDPAVQSVMESEFTNPDNFPEGSEVGLDWALTVDKADGSRVNYSREMLQTYFQEQGDENFDLNFSSQEEAQSYVDQYKAAVVGEGDTIVAERISFVPEPQACMTVIDQSTGEVRGIVGGRGEKTGSLTLDRATDSERQPGSTFKILSTYGPALERGEITLATTETDDQFNYRDGQEVKNSDNTHHGTMTVRKAIETSNNVIAAKLITQITPEVGYDYLTRLGITTLDSDKDTTQSLALGGITNGVSNLELTAAYAAVANKGVYNKPAFYTKVTDRSGNVLLENASSGTKVFKESTAYLLTSAMEDVMKAGTGTQFQMEDTSIAVAGKTGTTDSYKDLVFVGYTPYYTCGIWTGYDTNEELSENERQYINTLWTNVMNRIHEGKAAKNFAVPDSVEEVSICSQSGLLAGTGCPVSTEYFAEGTAPTTVCTQHIPTPVPTAAPTVAPDITQEASQGADAGTYDGTDGTGEDSGAGTGGNIWQTIQNLFGGGDTSGTDTETGQ